jgi:hypothetical protein
MGGDYLMPVIARYGVHPITDGFKAATFFPTARSLRLSPGERGMGPSVRALAYTSEGSFGETDLALLKKGRAAPDGNDPRGPLVAAAIAEYPDKSKGGTLVVFGDADFMTNGFFKLSANGELMINTLNYLLRQEALSGEKPKKKEETKPLVLTRSQGSVLFFLPVLIIPGLFFAAGIYVFRRMRREK